MHDARALIEMGPEAVRRLARRGYTLDLPVVEELQSRRNRSIHSIDELRAESKKVASEVQQVARQGGDIAALKETARKLKEQIRDLEAGQEQAQAQLTDLLLSIPNLPDERTPGRRLGRVRNRGSAGWSAARVLLRSEGPRRSRRSDRDT